MHKLILHHTWTFLSTKVGLIKVCECARKNICKCFTGIVKKNYTLITKPNGIGTPTIFLQNVKRLGISHIFNRRWFRNWPQRISGVSFGQQWASPVFPFPKKNRKINHNFHWIRQFYQINIYSSFKPISFIYTTYIIYCVLLFSDFFFLLQKLQMTAVYHKPRLYLHRQQQSVSFTFAFFFWNSGCNTHEE